MIRKATLQDLPQQRAIILEGKETLRQLNIDMWAGEYPTEAEMIADIESGNAYVYCSDGEVVATFALFYGIDPIYEKLENGQWLSDLPYSVLKRLSVKGTMRGQNITGKIIEAIGMMSIAAGYPSLRLDTHPGNKSMKRAIEKNGYQYTGELNTDQTWHAYEKVVTQSPHFLQKATKDDIPDMMVIINDAKENLRKMGIDQWQNGYPNEAVLMADIEKGNSYLYLEDGKLLGVLALIYGADPLYQRIDNGKWKTDLSYSVIHRIAVARESLGKGVIGRIFKLAELLTLTNGYESMRIDTHPDNKSMQRAIAKAEYEYCGHVFMEDGAMRLAFEKPIIAEY